MLLDRSCKPGDEDILFHYCSPEAFLGLTQKRHLWFSDALSMNDSMELKWGYSIYEEARNELSGQIKMEFFLEVEKVFYTTAHGALPLVCCFSLDGDVLSQWRAYAQDGRGFAVGFSAKELMNMPARFLKVLYNREQQVDEMKAILQRIYEAQQSEGFTYARDFKVECQGLALDWCALKNPAFREEQEVRLSHVIIFTRDANGLSLRSQGGTAWGSQVEGEVVNFRLRSEILVPYVALDFSNRGAVNPIKRVMLGPKNRNSRESVELYLNTVGLKGVEVRHSDASYV